MTKILEINNLPISIDKKEILKNINFDLKEKEIVVLIGKNGMGKSSILNAITLNENYKITQGDIKYFSKSIKTLKSFELAKKGIFLSFQNPIEIEGITFSNFLKTTYNSIKNLNLNISDFYKILSPLLEKVGLDNSFRKRFVNVGFSGGEKKRSELLQLLLIKPKLALIDEIDSGLDINGVKLIREKIKELNEKENTTFLIISHNMENIKKLNPNRILLLKDSNIQEIDKNSDLEKYF